MLSFGAAEENTAHVEVAKGEKHAAQVDASTQGAQSLDIYRLVKPNGVRRRLRKGLQGRPRRGAGIAVSGFNEWYALRGPYCISLCSRLGPTGPQMGTGLTRGQMAYRDIEKCRGASR